ncbi:MAG TPA: hypothetical protein VK869_04720 [Rubrobacteraceae bacterium]|nr:hypothetical protein [Rubrobacteraceae bacterium]
MIEVTLEVARGDVRRRVAVQAESITLALEIAGRQNPGCEVGVTFPIDPESFFVNDSRATRERPEPLEAA